MNTKNLSKFIDLCDAVKRKEKITYGVNEIEKELLDVLNYIKIYKKGEEEIKAFLIKIVKGEEIYPLEIIIFCMRELQWLEIKEAAIEEKTKTHDWRIISSMNHILEVYENNWECADMYEYYSKEVKK
jgi:hypothetical protein